MAREWKARPTPKPESITACARRYHACAVALAQTLGLSLAEVLTQYHQAVTSIFIESSRQDLRVPAAVKLPPLVAAVPEASTNGQREEISADAPVPQPVGAPVHDAPPPPTTIPVDAGLPLGGRGIATLKPAQLHMILNKVTRLAAEKGGQWEVLRQALAAERERRLARGVKRPATDR